MSSALDSRLRAAVHELADGGRPVDLADAALRGAVRRRRTHSAVWISAVAAVVALAALVAGGSLGRNEGQPAGGAGQFVVSSFRAVDDPGTYVLDPATGAYRKTPYAWAVVSPDGRQAAVLPQPGPDGQLASTRVGLLDVRTGAVGWVTTPERIWAPVWSPDGKTVLAAVVPGGGFGSGPNTGFLRLEVGSQRVTSTPVGAEPHPTGPFLWGPDGSTVITSTDTGGSDSLAGRPGGPVVYDLGGRVMRRLAVLANVLTLDPWSPSGLLLVLDGQGSGGRPQQLVVEVVTGRVVSRVDTPHPALGWRDDRHLLVRTDDGTVESVEAASGHRETVGRLPRADVDDVFVSPAADLPPAARQNAF